MEEEVAWDDDFDEKIEELFKGDFQRDIFRSAIVSTPLLKGLDVEVLDGCEAVLLTAPWC